MGINYDNITQAQFIHASGPSIEWVSPAEGNLGFVAGGFVFDTQCKVRVVNNLENTPVVFSVSAGTIASGLALNSSTGVISGTLANTEASYSFTIRATLGDIYAEKAFTMDSFTNQAPYWISNAGLLGVSYDGTSINATVVAADPDGDDLHFSVVTGSLPLGTTLNANTGVISGTAGAVPDNTTYFFTLRVSDGALYADRAFSYTINYNNPPVWTTPAGLLSGGQILETRDFSYQLEATDANGDQNLTYVLQSGSLPAGIALEANGLVHGTANTISQTADTRNFTVGAFDGLKTTPRNFSIIIYKNVAPVWSTSGTIVTALGGSSINYQLVANDQFESVSYSLNTGSVLPNTISLYSNGIIDGTLPLSDQRTDYNFVAKATDDSGLFSLRGLKITGLANTFPSWTTPDDLGDVLEDYAVSKAIRATDTSGVIGRTITYSLANGSTLPSGLSLSTNGNLTGTAPTVLADTDYSFDVVATDGFSPTTKTFTLSVKNDLPPVWTTNAAIFPFYAKGRMSISFAATDPNGTSITYTKVSGTIPAGLELKGNTIDGVPSPVSEDTDYSITMSASDGKNTPVQRTFVLRILKNTPPVWDTDAYLGSGYMGTTSTYTIAAHDAEGQSVSFHTYSSLPTGVSLSGNTITVNHQTVAHDTDITFTIFATDGTMNYGTSTSETGRLFKVTTLFTAQPVFTGPTSFSYISELTIDRYITAINNGNQAMAYTLVSGSLPSGVTFTNGHITGTAPDVSGSVDYTFTVEADNGIFQTQQEYTMTINENLPPVWISNSGSIGLYAGNNPVNVQLSATDPNGLSVTYSLANSTILPDGFSLSSSGLITGEFDITANVATYDFTVAASDGIFSTNRDFSISVSNDAAPVWVTNAGSLGSVKELRSFAVNLQAIDAETNPLHYAISNGALPDGFSISSVGRISGTANTTTTDTTYTFEVSASDDGDHTIFRTFSLTVLNDLSPTWVTPTGSVGSVLSGYTGSFGLSASDTETDHNLTYALVSGSLPTGFSLSSSGLISGTAPLQLSNSTSTFTVEATDFADNRIQRSFSVDVLRNLPPVFNTANGALGTQNEGNAISIQLDAYDPESLPLTFSVTSGSLPTGISLGSSTGLISGTLSSVIEDTISNFSVTATDGRQTQTGVFSFTTLFISPPAFQTASGSLGSGLEQTQFMANIVATANNHNITYALDTGSSLPSGLSLNANTGAITGMLPPVSNDTPTNFTIKATDTVTSKSSTRSFSITTIKNLPPVWGTASGSVLSALEGNTFRVNLSVSDPNGTTPEVSNVGGNFVDGMFFDSANVALYGTLPAVVSNTTYNITLGASDGASRVDRMFTVTSRYNNPPVWVTNAGSLATADEGSAVSIHLVANDAEGNTVTYSMNSGSLADGLFLMSNGYIYGVLNAVSNSTTASFSVRASDSVKYTDRAFTYSVNHISAPVWATSNAAPIATGLENTSFSTSVIATAGVHTVTYSSSNLPSGVSLNTSNGLVYGIFPNNALANTSYSFDVAALDGTTLQSSSRNFSILSVENFAPVWVTSNATPLVSALEGTQFYSPLNATDANGTKVKYNLVSSTLANGMTFNDGNAVLLLDMSSVANSLPVDVASNLSVSYIGNAPTMYGAAQAKFGSGAVNFDTNSAVTVGIANSFVLSGDFTIEAWVKPYDKPTSVNYGIFGFGVPAQANSLMLTVSYASSFLSVEGRDAAGNLSTSYQNGKTPFNWTVGVPGSYQHVALTRENGRMNVWLNGELQSSTTSIGNTVINSNTIAIGSQSSASISSGFNGWIDDFRITNGVAIYTNAMTIIPTGELTTNATIYGTLPAVVSNTAYYANVAASDGNSTVNNSFSVTSIFNNPPVWSTTGSLGSQLENTNVAVTVSASDPEGNAVTYSVASGALPTGLSILSNGLIYGTLGAVSQETIANFVLAASDGAKSANSSTLSFTTQYTAAPVWVTPAALGNATAATAFSNTIVASSTNPLTYTLTAGSLPLVTTLNATTGVIFGTLSNVVSNTVSSFTIQAYDAISNKSNSRTFNMTTRVNLPPVWSTSNAAPLVSAFEGNSFTVSVSATDPNGQNVAYSQVSNTLANTMTFFAGNATLVGTMPSVVTNTSYTLTLAASDGNSASTRVFSVQSLTTAPIWNTNVSNTLATINNLTVNTAVNQAISPVGNPLTFAAVNSAALPSGVTISVNGYAQGTIDMNTYGNYNFTVRATDTITSKFADRDYVFRITQSDPYYANVAVLMNMDTETSNSTTKIPTELISGLTVSQFVSSTTNAAVTSSASKFGSGSLTFAGATTPQNCLIVSSVPALGGAGTGLFTIECWIYINSLATSQGIFSNRSFGGTNLTVSATLGTGGLVTFTCINTAGNQNSVTSTTPLATGQWHHIAVSKYATSAIRLFINGTLEGTPITGGIPSFTVISNNWAIGGAYSSGTSNNLAPFNGYIDDFRITTVDRYASGNFAVPTAPADTSFLVPTFVGNAYVDSKTVVIVNAETNIGTYPLEALSNSPVIANSSFGISNGITVSATQAKFGSNSVAFDGNAIMTLNLANVTLSGDFTVEAWVYPTANVMAADYGFFALGGQYNVQQTLQVGTQRANGPVKPHVQIWGNNNGISSYQNGKSAISSNQWSHVALTREGNQISLFFNGILEYTQVAPANLFGGNAIANTVTFGASSNAVGSTGLTNRFVGYMDDMRVSNGIARYSANTTAYSSGAQAPYQTYGMPVTAHSVAETDYITTGYTVNKPTTVSYRLGLPLTYTMDGTLPDGLLFDANSGTISGTPTAIGNSSVISYPYTIYVNDTYGHAIPRACKFVVSDFDPIYGGVTLHMPMNGDLNALPTEASANSLVTQSTASSTTTILSNTVTLYGQPTSMFTTNATGATSRYINVGGVAKMAGDFTIETWIYQTTTQTTYGEFLTAYATSAYPQPEFLLMTVAATGGYTVNFQFSNTTGIAGSSIITNNQWVHVAVTRTSGITSLFVNGVKQGSLTTFTGAVGTAKTSWQIGGSTFDNTNYGFRGYISDVRITKDYSRYFNTFAVPSAPLPIAQTPITWRMNSVVYLTNATTNYTNLIATQLGNATVSYAPSLNYSVTNGSTLPSGLTLLSNGLITGQATVAAGNYSVNFTAASANNVSMANTTLTLAVKETYDPYWSNVTVAMPMTGVAGTVPLEAKSNLTVIQNTVSTSTAVISTDQSKFYPSSLFTTSATGANGARGIYVANTPTMAGDFTVEAWIYPTARSATGDGANLFGYFTLAGQTAPTNWIAAMCGATSAASYLGLYCNGAFQTVGIAGTMPWNQWHHVAVSRKSGTTRLFLNGQQQGAAITALSGTVGTLTTTFSIGQYPTNGTYYLPGYVQDVRITNAVAKYDSNFLVPVQAYSVSDAAPIFNSSANTPVWISSSNQANVAYSATSYVPNTTVTYSVVSGSVANGTTLNSNGVLTGLSTMPDWTSNTFTLRASNGFKFTDKSFTVLTNGPADPYWSNVTMQITSESSNVGEVPIELKSNATVTRNVPANSSFGAVSTVQAKTGTQSMFVANSTSSNQFLKVANAVAMTGDFTIEAWVYPTALNTFNCILSNYPTGTATAANFFLAVNSAGKIVMNNDAGGNLVGTTVISTNTWTHVAITRENNILKIYLNGVLEVTSTLWTASIGSRSTFWSIGGYENTPASWNWQGYIDDVRITNGVARYGLNVPFTPPTTIPYST